MASSTAYLALVIWPIVVIMLFRARPLNEALAWSVIGGYLLLPQYRAFDLPVLPPWDKTLVPSLFAAIMCFVTLNAHRKRPPPRHSNDQSTRVRPVGPTHGIDDFVVRRGKTLYWGLIIVLFTTPFITTLTNPEPIVQLNRYVSGMRLYDAFSVGLKLLVATAPFFLARRFLASAESNAVLLKVIAVAFLAYSLLALWEVRMSPQLHSQIYGFFPHRWSQHVRYGGYRPVVFLNHGLWLAILMAMGSLATMALWRARRTNKNPGAGIWFAASIYMFGVVFLCKSAGAIIIVIVLLPVLLLLSIRMQMLIAAAVVSVIMTYPMLRGADVVPTNAIHSAVAKVAPDRARSLQIRFDAEDALLDHASRKPIAGWGSWGRNRATNEKGADIAATDGYWAIVVGVHGWLGYLAQFGLLGLATFFMAVNARRFELGYATAGLAIVLCAALIDLIPNATISPVVWLIAGAMMGRYQTALAKEKPAKFAARQTAATSSPTSEDDDRAAPGRDRPRANPRPVHVRKPREGY